MLRTEARQFLPRLLLSMAIVLALLSTRPACAEIKVIEADSTYVLGDNDSKVDARRIATQEAQRKALELAGTYVASLTQVKEFKLTKDEVTAYTAGIVETEIIKDEIARDPEPSGVLPQGPLQGGHRCAGQTDRPLPGERGITGAARSRCQGKRSPSGRNGTPSRSSLPPRRTKDRPTRQGRSSTPS